MYTGEGQAMLELIKGTVGDAAAPVIFLALFLAIGGGALWLTPRIARWLDKRSASHKGYYDGMLETPPEEEHREDQ